MAEDHDFETSPKGRIHLRIPCKSPGDRAETQDIVGQRNNRRRRGSRDAMAVGTTIICRSDSSRLDVLCGSDTPPKDS